MNNFSYSSFVSIHYIICECGDTFSTEKSLQQHLENKHKTNEYEYQCITCGMVFPTERKCMIHQQIHTASVKIKREPREPTRAKKRYYTAKNIVCEVCGKRYASNAALRYHQRVHTGERPYHCTMCPKTFTMPLFLQIHVRTHTGERPYQCTQCPKAFSNKAALLRHDRVHTGVKPYECPQCGKFFTQSNSMKLHVKTVHLKMPAPYKSKSRRAMLAMRQALAASVAAKEVQTPEPPALQKAPEIMADADAKPKYLPQVKIEAVDEEDIEKEDEEDIEKEDEAPDEEQAETYEVYQSNEESLYQEVKVEFAEKEYYEEDLEESEVVYEEVYEIEEI